MIPSNWNQIERYTTTHESIVFAISYNFTMTEWQHWINNMLMHTNGQTFSETTFSNEPFISFHFRVSYIYIFHFLFFNFIFQHTHTQYTSIINCVLYSEFCSHCDWVCVFINTVECVCVIDNISMFVWNASIRRETCACICERIVFVWITLYKIVSKRTRKECRHWFLCVV